MPTEGVKPFDPRAECAEPKAVYDACFKKWYSSKFLKGVMEVSEDCTAQFEELQDCINGALERRRRLNAASRE